MSDTYNKVLKAILCKVAEVDENIHENEIKKIQEIYFKLTGNHFPKLKIFKEVLESENHKSIDDYLKENINSLDTVQKTSILHAVEELIPADGINHIEEEKFLAKLKKVIFEFN
tara:strand:- start:6094 stop:6435 length:342 start_codon:yes stop_codon:yes gene_type:complete